MGAIQGGVATYIQYTDTPLPPQKILKKEEGMQIVNIFLSHCKDDFIVDLVLLLLGMWMTT